MPPLLFDYWSHVSHFHRLASLAALRSTDTHYVEIHRACLLWCRSTLSFDSVLHFYSLRLAPFRRFGLLLVCDILALSAIIVVSALEFLYRLQPQILFLTFLHCLTMLYGLLRHILCLICHWNLFWPSSWHIKPEQPAKHVEAPDILVDNRGISWYVGR